MTNYTFDKHILDKTHPSSLRFLFRTWVRLIKGTGKPKFTTWVKEFIPESLVHNPQKTLNLSTKNFEEWGNSPRPDI